MVWVSPLQVGTDVSFHLDLHLYLMMRNRAHHHRRGVGRSHLSTNSILSFVLWGAMTVIFVAVCVSSPVTRRNDVKVQATEEEVGSLGPFNGPDRPLIQYGEFFTRQFNSILKHCP